MRAATTVPTSLEHRSFPPILWTVLAVEALTGLGCSQLILGIFFFTTGRLGWQPRHNLLMAAAQGLVYVFAALAAERFSRRLGRRQALVVASVLSLLVALIGLIFRDNSTLIAITLLLYTIVSTLVWPVLESTVATGCGADEMGRRIGVYNLVWSGMNIVGVALIGTLITYWPAGVFVIPIAAHAIAAVVIAMGPSFEIAPASVDLHAEPEEGLLGKRRLALWLSRLALPATYMVAYAMMAMMPTLPVMQGLSTSTQSLLGSIWLAVRWLAFLFLGATTWWHTRPLWLLWAIILMLAAFFGITIPLSDVSRLLGASIGPDGDLAAMILWQILLGLAVALIYSSSLYFGMVLSDASTEHGGYHEALIGFGSVLGPGSGALARYMFPQHAWVSIAAVGGVIALTAMLAGAAAIRARRPSKG